MKYKYVIVFVLIFLTYSCSTPKKPDNEAINSIPLLEISDSIFHNQLVDIIFSSECYTEFQHQRKVFYLFESTTIRDSGLINISFLSYCCFEKEDLMGLYGGFILINGNNTYLFVLSNRQLISENVYKLSDNIINISKYLGVIEESDVIWHIKNLEGKLELNFNYCP